MERLDRLIRLISEKRRESEVAESEAGRLELKLGEAKEEAAAWGKAASVIQSAAEDVQTAVHARITKVVTRCLAAVFDDPYEFRLEFEKKRGKTEARMFFVRDGNEVDPIEASGLGVVDVASFALRVAVLRLHTPPVDQVLCFDEPFKWVDGEAIERVRDLMLALAEETGIQFILTTHDPALKVGKVVRVG